MPNQQIHDRCSPASMFTTPLPPMPLVETPWRGWSSTTSPIVAAFFPFSIGKTTMIGKVTEKLRGRYKVAILNGDAVTVDDFDETGWEVLNYCKY